MQADNTFDDQIGRDLSVRGARVSPGRSPAWHGNSTWSDQLTSAVRLPSHVQPGRRVCLSWR
jgi:hypothetical protein